MLNLRGEDQYPVFIGFIVWRQNERYLYLPAICNSSELPTDTFVEDRVTFRGHCYKAFTELRMNYNESVQICRFYDSYLVTIETHTEFLFLMDYLGGLNPGQIEVLPEDHPSVQLWWTGGLRIDNQWVWQYGERTEESEYIFILSQVYINVNK